jgi:hypothetical protein
MAKRKLSAASGKGTQVPAAASAPAPTVTAELRVIFTATLFAPDAGEIFRNEATMSLATAALQILRLVDNVDSIEEAFKALVAGRRITEGRRIKNCSLTLTWQAAQ